MQRKVSQKYYTFPSEAEIYNQHFYENSAMKEISPVFAGAEWLSPLPDIA
jgi:hypothetical protein